MKSAFKISNLQTSEDVSNIRNAISKMEGIIAVQVNKDKKEVNVVYDDYFINAEEIILSIEDSGYTVL